MPAGLGAGGAVGVALETAAAAGTWVTPAVWVPVVSESLTYSETRYFSEAIRQQTIHNAVKQGPYFVEGDIEMEFDARWVPYFMYATRHPITKTGATAPFQYRLVPGSSATIPASNRTLSITIIRNGQGFEYTGCVVTNFTITIDAGVTRFNCHVIGTTQVTTGSPPTPSYVAPRLLGATSQSIAVGDGALTTAITAGGTAMTGATVNVNFNGFTFVAEDNGAAQNRVNQSRAASYISFGVTAANATTDLDFLDLVDFNHFLNTDSKRLQFISGEVAGAIPITQNRVTLDIYNSVFETYDVSLGTWDALIMATSNFHVISSGGAAPPFDLMVETDQAITPA